MAVIDMATTKKHPRDLSDAEVDALVAACAATDTRVLLDTTQAVYDRSMAQCSASCVPRQRGVAPQKNDSRRPSLQRKPLVCRGARLVRSSE